MKLPRSRFLEIAVLLLVISYPLVSEVIYHRNISPGEAEHFAEFVDMISHESSVRVFETVDGTVMQFRGLLPRRGLLALPSAAPFYYFDSSGTFIGWVRDPGDLEIPDKFRPIGEAKLISFEEAKCQLLERN